MSYIIKVINKDLYEKRTSTLRHFGGRIQLTNDINEAKRITRETDANARVRMINTHWRRSNKHFPEMLDLPLFECIKV